MNASWIVVVAALCTLFGGGDEATAWGWQPLLFASRSNPSARRTDGRQHDVSCNLLFGNHNKDESPTSSNNNKFGMIQRIDSAKSGIVGAISASVGSTWLLAIHDSTLPEWEFDTDGAAISGGLFAIVYRYCVRNDDTNPQLTQGVVGAFSLVRTVARIHVPADACSAIPLSCGPPLGILNWDMIFQLAWYGAESLAMFGCAAYAMEFVTKRGFISRFPG